MQNELNSSDIDFLYSNLYITDYQRDRLYVLLNLRFYSGYFARALLFIIPVIFFLLSLLYVSLVFSLFDVQMTAFALHFLKPFTDYVYSATTALLGVTPLAQGLTWLLYFVAVILAGLSIEFIYIGVGYCALLAAYFVLSKCLPIHVFVSQYIQLQQLTELGEDSGQLQKDIRRSIKSTEQVLLQRMCTDLSGKTALRFLKVMQLAGLSRKDSHYVLLKSNANKGTLLHTACKYGQLQLLKQLCSLMQTEQLIQQLNIKDEFGMTPVMYACAYKQESAITVLRKLAGDKVGLNININQIKNYLRHHNQSKLQRIKQALYQDKQTVDMQVLLKNASTLKEVTQNPQNTHDERINRSVHNSILYLLKRYGQIEFNQKKTQNALFNRFQKDLSSAIRDPARLQTDTLPKVGELQAALNIFLKLKRHIDARLRHVLALMLHACYDEAGDIYETVNRRLRFLCHELPRCTVCPTGNINNLVNALDRAHPCVRVEREPLHKAQAQVQQLFHDFTEQLDATAYARLAYLFDQLPLSNPLAGRQVAELHANPHFQAFMNKVDQLLLNEYFPSVDEMDAAIEPLLNEAEIRALYYEIHFFTLAEKSFSNPCSGGSPLQLKPLPAETNEEKESVCPALQSQCLPSL